MSRFENHRTIVPSHHSSVTFPRDANHTAESPTWGSGPSWGVRLVCLLVREPRNTKDSREPRNQPACPVPRLPFHTMGIAPRNHRYGGREPSRMPCPGAKQPKNRQMSRILVRGIPVPRAIPRLLFHTMHSRPRYP